MQDRPTFDELLSAVEQFLDNEIVPSVEGSRGFHARVAANAIRILRRELDLEDAQLAAEWASLDGVLGAQDRPGDRKSLRAALLARNEALCTLIRAGDADDGDTASQVYEHVRRTVRDKLLVTNPDLLARSEAPGNARP